MRKFEIGSKVHHSEMNVTGIVLRFYTPTSCAEQTSIRTSDGRRFHAPTSEFESYKQGLRSTMSIIDTYAGIDLASSEDVLVRRMYNMSNKTYTNME